MDGIWSGRGKLEQVWLCTLPSVAKPLGRFLGLRRGCRSRSGVEAFPYPPLFPWRATLPQGAKESPACSCRRLHTLPQPSSHGQTPPRPLPAVGPGPPSLGRLCPGKLPTRGWSRPLSKPSCCLKPSFLPLCPDVRPAWPSKGFPAAACSCYVIQSVTPRESPALC